MSQIKFSKEGIDTIFSQLTNIKDSLGNLIKDNELNLNILVDSWQGKKANFTLENIEKLKNNNAKLLEKMENNLEYIREVIKTYEEADKNGVVEKGIVTKENTTLPNFGSVKSPKIDYSKGTVKVTDDILNNLGVKRDSSGKPIMVGNMFVLRKHFGSDYNDYLLFLPMNANKEIPVNAPIFLEFHGNGGSRVYLNKGEQKTATIEQLGKYEMGINHTSNNPNFPGIILMPQANSAGNTGDGSERFNKIYKDVVKSFAANDDGAIVTAFSAGGASFYRYAQNYSSDIKAAYVVDPSTYTDKLQNVPENLPVTFFTSQKKDSKKDYTNLLTSSYKNLKRDLSYDTISAVNVDFRAGVNNFDANDPNVAQNQIINQLSNSNVPGARVINIPGTNHEKARDIVFSQYFYDTIYNLWFGSS